MARAGARYDSFLDDAPGTRWLVVRAAAVVLVLAGLVALFAWASPAEHIINGGRIWQCGYRGGSTEVELPEIAGLRPGYYLSNHGRAGGLAAADLYRVEDRKRIGNAVFNLDPQDFGAVNALAREY